MEPKPIYEANPLSELCTLLTPDELLKLVLELRRVKDAGGWGEIRLPFKRFRLARPVTTVLPQYEEDGALQNP